MSEEQVRQENHHPAENQQSPVAVQKKKKTSWLRTILWMLAMLLLANVIMVTLFYVLYHYKIIQ